jgi:hypothetical protein
MSDTLRKTARSGFVVLGVVATACSVLAGPASAQIPPPPSGAVAHCVSDDTYSLTGGTYAIKTHRIKAEVCSYRVGSRVSLALDWTIPANTIDHAWRGLEEGAFVFQLWDCTTGKAVIAGSKDYEPYGNGDRHGGEGSATTKTHALNSKHKYKVRVEGAGSFLWNSARYKFIGYAEDHSNKAINSYGRCYW